MSRGQSAPSQRQLRVGETLRHILAELLERGNIRDADVISRPITITSVSVSPDLRHATVYVMPLGGGEVSAMLEGLKRVSSFLRRESAKKMTSRTVPDLVFKYDETFENARHIEALLDRPEVKRDILKQDSQSQSPDTI